MSPDFSSPGLWVSGMEPVQGSSGSGVGARGGAGRAHEGTSQMAELEGLCIVTEDILQIQDVLADTWHAPRSYWWDRRSKGTRVAFSEMLPNDFSKMHHPFPFPSWSKNVATFPHSTASFLAFSQ